MDVVDGCFGLYGQRMEMQCFEAEFCSDFESSKIFYM